MTRLASNRRFPKILLITRNFPPLRGGMERLNARMFEFLHSANPGSALIGPAGSGRFVSNDAQVAELPSGPLPATLLAGLARGMALARSIRPDVVLAGSGLMAPAVIAASRVSNAVPMTYLHGLDIVAPSRVYRTVWVPCIRRCRCVLVNSRNTRRLAIEAGVEPNRISVVHPGTDLARPDPDARRRFRERYGIAEGAPMLLSVGRLTARKGIAEFVESSLPAIKKVYPDACLVIVGDEAPDALKRSYGGGIAPIRAAAEARGIGSAIQWLGALGDGDLSDAYQAADLHVFPVRETAGDVEGFGMVGIEAAACGLRTIAFDVGGVADAVADGVNGRLVPAGDYDGFARAAVRALAESGESEREHARAFARSFSWERFGQEVADAVVAAT